MQLLILPFINYSLTVSSTKESAYEVPSPSLVDQLSLSSSEDVPPPNYEVPSPLHQQVTPPPHCPGSHLCLSSCCDGGGLYYTPGRERELGRSRVRGHYRTDYTHTTHFRPWTVFPFSRLFDQLSNFSHSVSSSNGEYFLYCPWSNCPSIHGTTPNVSTNQLLISKVGKYIR